MIKKNLRVLIITSLVILLPVLLGVILWNKLPQQMPIHWNASGEVDGWSSKAFAVFGMPLVMLAVQWLCVCVTQTDPKKKNHSEKMLWLVFWIVPVIGNVIFAFTYAAALGREVPVEILLPVLLGVGLVVIGNYMPKCRQNYTIGIKLPWTLSSEENWNKTHRLAGWVWVIGGLVMMASGFVAGFWLALAVTLLMALIPMIYSYVLHRKGV